MVSTTPRRVGRWAGVCLGPLMVALSLTAPAGCSPREGGEGPAGPARIALEPCRLEGVSRPARCGRVSVFEDREKAQGRQLELFVAVLPARSRSVEPDPIFLLAGGPGQGASATFGPLLGAFEELSDERDMVLLDQRGTGRSAPLRCDPHADDLRRVFAEDSLARVAAECRATLEAQLTQYTTPVAADDLDDVRAALGYRRINLVGMSYGTRLALVYLRRHPARVRSLVLDGVAPTSMALPLFAARDGQRAFDQLVADCQAEEACAAAYPSLAEDFAELLASLESGPHPTTIEHPRSGEPVTLPVGRTALASTVHGLLYSAELASLLPYTITRAAEGDFSPFVAQAALLADEQSRLLNLGLLLSVVCTEDVDRIETRMEEVKLSDTFLRDGLVEDWRRACADWPRAELPEGYARPTQGEQPVLLLSGALDPVTPPSWAAEVASHLTDATQVVVPAVGHGTVGRGCVSDLVTQFIQASSGAGLDVGCVSSLRRPPFFVSFAGPVP